ncbi:hypothetical protein B0H13DRAFT_2301072 [Mycena leptocephala]|nr:hypothetical protein B0H13DRAFT_2301072 [Mycena leptocephala]
MARCKQSTRSGSPSGPVTFKTDAYRHLRTSGPFCLLLKLLLDHSSIVKENREDLAARYEPVVPALKLHFDDIDALHAPDDLLQLLNPLHEILAHLGGHAKSIWLSSVYPKLAPNEIHKLPVDWDFPDISDPSCLKIARSPPPFESLNARADRYEEKTRGNKHDDQPRSQSTSVAHDYWSALTPPNDMLPAAPSSSLSVSLEPPQTASVEAPISTRAKGKRNEVDEGNIVTTRRTRVKRTRSSDNQIGR